MANALHPACCSPVAVVRAEGGTEVLGPAPARKVRWQVLLLLLSAAAAGPAASAQDAAAGARFRTALWPSCRLAPLQSGHRVLVSIDDSALAKKALAWALNNAMVHPQARRVVAGVPRWWCWGGGRGCRGGGSIAGGRRPTQPPPLPPPPPPHPGIRFSGRAPLDLRGSAHPLPSECHGRAAPILPPPLPPPPPPPPPPALAPPSARLPGSPHHSFPSGAAGTPLQIVHEDAVEAAPLQSEEAEGATAESMAYARRRAAGGRAGAGGGRGGVGAGRPCEQLPGRRVGGPAYHGGLILWPRFSAPPCGVN